MKEATKFSCYRFTERKVGKNPRESDYMQKIRKVHWRSEGLYNIALEVKSKEYVQWVFNQSMQYRKCLLFTLSSRPHKLKITLIRTMVRDLISVPSHVQERLTISTLPPNQLPLINQIQELLLDINIKQIFILNMHLGRGFK